MAAVYLHNAIHSTPPPTPQSALSTLSISQISHIRRVSDLSAGSHSTDFDSWSHSLSDNASYQYLISRQPAHPADPNSQWDPGLNLLPEAPTAEELRWETDRMIRKRIRRWRRVKSTTGLIIVSWAAYCGIRYFVAVAKYSYDPLRQRYALALGIACFFTFLSLVFDILVHFFYRVPSLYYGPSLALLSLASLTLFLSAAANLTLTALWRHSNATAANPEPFAASRALHGRCSWDVDVVWTGTGLQCSHGVRWGFFLAGAIARLCLTTFALLAFHTSLSQYHTAVHLPHTSLYANITGASLPMMGTPGTFSSDNHQSPQTVSRPRSRKSSQLRDNRLSRGSGLSNVVEKNEYEETEPGSSTQASSHHSRSLSSTSSSVPSDDSSHTVTQLLNWASDFRALVDAAREVDDEDIIFRAPDEIDRVRMLGGVVHRMSTIESLGSRESQGQHGAGPSRKDSLGSATTLSHTTSGPSRKESFVSARSALVQSHVSGELERKSSAGLSRKGSLLSTKSISSRKGSLAEARHVDDNLAEEPEMEEREQYEMFMDVPAVEPEEFHDAAVYGTAD